MHEIEKTLKVISVRSIRQSYSHPLIFFFAQQFYCFSVFRNNNLAANTHEREIVCAFQDSSAQNKQQRVRLRWRKGDGWKKRQNESFVRLFLKVLI